MYAIYGNICHQYTPVMLAYIPYMDPMGNDHDFSTWIVSKCPYQFDESIAATEMMKPNDIAGCFIGTRSG